ncbi:MAG: class I tRNA ligase family protein, partial [Planctomycetes bacterium]|nr:class I tRNA ligase family protein [Planctomycetota bacterium]
RDELVGRIWKGKDQYENRILSQLKLMGCSCDWKRTRFSLDDGLAQAVRTIFFKLFKDGLIFRGKRLVNWDTQLQTAVSDDEVYHETVKGHFWHIKYPVIDPKAGEPEFVIIATTRPETMLGDTAVAVHPDPENFFAESEKVLTQARKQITDQSSAEATDLAAKLDSLAERRATHLAELVQLRDMAQNGRMVRLPLVERAIPLICDNWADPTKGSGCVKVTPAHDPNDYEVGLRHDLPMINVLAPDGTIAPIIESNGSKNAHSSQYEGLLFAAAGREKVVADLDAKDLLHKVEDHVHEVGHSDRSKFPIEPYLSDQWFLKTSDVDQETLDRKHIPGEHVSRSVILGDGTEVPGLAQGAMDAVEDGRIKVFPPRYAKSYLDWLGEKRDWCISRQLWWGHRIPVWTSRRQTRPVRISELMGEWHELPIGRAAGDGSSHTIDFRAYNDEPPASDRELMLATGYVEDEDVLDTWFSSALWPFSTLGWPEETKDLKQYYPGSVLVTSRDIITNWVARMVMFGLYARGRVPFDHVYIHPKILDGRGETMSKSKGNGVDPVDVIHTHGADALRYAMADMTTETQDIRMPIEYICPHCKRLTDQAVALKNEEQARKSRGQKLDRRLQPSDCVRIKCVNKECGKDFATQWADQALKDELSVARETSDKFDLGRNFCNKLWNAARFAFLNLEGTTCQQLDIAALPPEDRWILSRLSQTVRAYHECIRNYRFSASVKELREFFWDSLCDWYIELTKPRLA